MQHVFLCESVFLRFPCRKRIENIDYSTLIVYPIKSMTIGMGSLRSLVTRFYNLYWHNI